MDGAKDCMFYHPKPKFKGDSTDLDVSPIPQYAMHECLPKEYLDKVKNYFDDTQITNVNMIQSLMKQVSQQFAGMGVGGVGGGLGQQRFSTTHYNDQFDLQSLLGGLAQSNAGH